MRGLGLAWTTGDRVTTGNNEDIRGNDMCFPQNFKIKLIQKNFGNASASARQLYDEGSAHLKELHGMMTRRLEWHNATNA